MHFSENHLISGKTAPQISVGPRHSPPPIPAPESQWALFLDVDGTLLDLAPDPDSVKIPAGLVDLLAKLSQRLNGALALISGRRVEALDKLFKPLRLPCVGLHGFEWRNSAGRESRLSIDDSALQIMRTAAARLSDKFPGVLMEDKGLSIAFHFRNDRQHAAALRKEIDAIARNTCFFVQDGIDVYEICPFGADKGDGLSRLMRDRAFRYRLPIFIGDDITDEKALAAAQKFTGMGIQVGSIASTHSRFLLSNPGAVLQWLYRWEEQLS